MSPLEYLLKEEELLAYFIARTQPFMTFEQITQEWLKFKETINEETIDEALKLERYKASVLANRGRLGYDRDRANAALKRALDKLK